MFDAAASQLNRHLEECAAQARAIGIRAEVVLSHLPALAEQYRSVARDFEALANEVAASTLARGS